MIALTLYAQDSVYGELPVMSHRVSLSEVVSCKHPVGLIAGLIVVTLLPEVPPEQQELFGQYLALYEPLIKTILQTEKVAGKFPVEA